MQPMFKNHGNKKFMMKKFKKFKMKKFKKIKFK